MAPPRVVPVELGGNVLRLERVVVGAVVLELGVVRKVHLGTKTNIFLRKTKSAKIRSKKREKTEFAPALPFFWYVWGCKIEQKEKAFHASSEATRRVARHSGDI